MADHKALAFAYALQSAHLRVLKQQIQCHAIAVHGDYTGDNEQQRPEENEYTLEDVQPDDTEEHAERIEKVPVACLHSTHRAQAVDREAGADHKRHYAYGEIKKSCARSRKGLLDRIGKLIRIKAVVCACAKADVIADTKLLINRLKLKRRAADKLIR